MSREDKPLVWLHGEIRTPPFSVAARREAGELLREVQQGEMLSLPHSRPMPSIGSGCHELRIDDEDRSWRIVYAIREKTILILEVFPKTTKETPVHIIVACRRRMRRYHEISRGA